MGEQTHISDLAQGSHGWAPVVVFFPGHILCQAAGGEGVVPTQEPGLPSPSPSPCLLLSSSQHHTCLDYYTSLLTIVLYFCPLQAKLHKAARGIFINLKTDQVTPLLLLKHFQSFLLPLALSINSSTKKSPSRACDFFSPGVWVCCFLSPELLDPPHLWPAISHSFQDSTQQFF